MIWKDTTTGKIYNKKGKIYDDHNPDLQLDYNEKGVITEESLKKNFNESDWHDGIIVIPTDNNFAVVLQFNGKVSIADNVSTAEQFEEGKGYCKVTTTNNEKRIMAPDGTLILPSAGKLISKIFNDPLSIKDISDEDFNETIEDFDPTATIETFFSEVKNIVVGITEAGYLHYTAETLRLAKKANTGSSLASSLFDIMLLAVAGNKIKEDLEKYNNMLREFANNKLQELTMACIIKGYKF